MSDEAKPVPQKIWAVVTTGVITPSGLPLFLQAGGQLYPVPVFYHQDRAKCEAKKASLTTKAGRAKFYDGPNMQPSQPIFGVVEITLPAKRPMSAERIAKMQAGRKKDSPPKQEPAIAGKVQPPKK